MYFVDRDQIENQLTYLEGQINLFEGQQTWPDPLSRAALERMTQMMLEAVLDVGNAMIDGFIMRDPGSYEDIIDILMDEKVIAAETGADLKVLIPFRKKLVQLYTEIDHAQLIEQFTLHLPAIKVFPKNVRDYLQNELGPVSAFKN
ncbi:DUF86 domain-containing protein [Neobacillus dielmonensis]|uniref:DUF86 domain-containing protein n=1 Tax=Neobacillus dielmonensis TaxID=1347369 RepID=UPI0005A64D3B|nr:DUF86 domain-containing protein [Neobacillus dielmonensis]